MNSIFDQNSEFLKYLQSKKDQDAASADKSHKTVEMHIAEDGSLLKKVETEKGKDKDKDKDAYVLNLKSHSIREPRIPEPVAVKKQHEPKPTPKQAPSAQIDRPSQKKLDKLHKISQPPSLTTDFKGFVWDKLKFILTTALIFGVSFVALNWSAYKTVFYGHYLNLTGQQISTPLSEFSQAESTANTHAGTLYASYDIPKLQLEVTPPGTRIIVPRLGSNVPVIGVSDEKLLARNWEGLEKEIQDALRGGVVHYPGTPYPNQSGNVVVTGHSSYYPWDPGRFKDVFAVLHQAQIGDEIIMFHNQKKYIYKITDIKKVLPTEVNVLGDSGDDRLTLITCTPIGTNLKRLIVTAKPVK